MRIATMRFVLLGIFIIGLFSAGAKTSSKSTVAIEQNAKQIVIRWNGDVDEAMLPRLRDAFRPFAAGKHRIVLSLHSNGGSVKHGSEVMAFIRQMQRIHDVDTTVEAKNYCASMCVPIFLLGQDRAAAPSARFMFHEVSFQKTPEVMQKLRELQQMAPRLDQRAFHTVLITGVTDDFFGTFLEPMGVDGRWLATVRSSIKGGRSVWLTAAELKKQNSGIVDAVRDLQ